MIIPSRGATPDAYVVDDTGFPKDGKASPLVARMYSGTLGKTANCQIGVSVQLVTDAVSLAGNWRLFCPESWDDTTVADPAKAQAVRERRARARIPDEVRHREKWRLALDMLDQMTDEWGLPRRPVSADAGYGDATEFRLGLEGGFQRSSQHSRVRGVAMAGRGRPGPAPQTAKREQYAALIARGVGFSEACRIVGINRRTGKRWRHGRTITSSSGRRLHYAPVVGVRRKREISARFLSEDERVRIADLRRAGEGVRAIARELGRSPATVSRELRRNVDAMSGAYRPHAAQRLAEQRRARPKTGKLVADVELREFVQDRLKRRWSPEQIAHALRSQFPDQPHRHVVPETIYQAVYRSDLGGLCRDLPKALRSGRLRRRPHRRAGERRGRLVNMTMIDQRPREAADREIAGHWEGDLITGESNRSAIGTLVERSSRYVILLHLPGRHTAEAVRDAVIDAMRDLPVQLRRSLTWDQGSEMALHAEIAQALGMPVYFCEEASPWQRPSNENANRLLRQYFPKGTDLRRHDAERLAAVADELNTRPRKTLSWQTPAARLANVTNRAAPASATGRGTQGPRT